MAATQTLRLPDHFSTYTPTSPDPTPLRLLAFSVAESALECDPNSPLFMTGTGVEGDWVGPWCDGFEGKKAGMGESRGRLWGIVERANERREKDQFFVRRPSSPLASPPISPSSYSFSASSKANVAPIKAARPTPPTLTLPIRQNRPLQTRSAEPSPVKCTFSNLDRSKPPPEFIPRLSASEFAQVENTRNPVTLPVEPPKSPSAVLRKQAVTQTKGRNPKGALPSLAQIHAKMSKTRTHKRGASLGAVPQPRTASLSRSDTQDSMEVLVTPTDENPHQPREPRVVLQSIINRSRSPTPPSPTVPLKESTLAPFLRQRTSGRLATATAARTISTPPSRTQTSSPVLKITPPTLDSTIPPQPSTPTRVSGYPFPRLATPPPGRCGNPSSPSPTSPTFSQASMASPTLSVPIITCTPAPQRVRRNGVEEDSDEEEGSVVVFSAEEEGEREREMSVGSEGEGEREKRGREMKALLRLRRKSDS